MENESLLKKTLLYVAAMVGACVVVVGALAVLAVAIVGRAVHPAADNTESPALVPADKIDKGGKPPIQPKVQLPKANPI